MRVTRLLASCLTALGLATSALAQAPAPEWPSRPVRIIAQYAAGGGSDVIARIVAEHLSRRTGQPFIVENRPGGGGNISTEMVVRAPADGHTLLIAASGPIAVNRHLYKKLAFDPTTDLTPIAFAASEMFALVAHPSAGFSSVQDFIAKAKAQPSKYSFASGGVGAGTHLTAELFRRAADIELVHVPYKGGVPALNDVVAGVVPVTFANVTSASNFQKAGKLDVLAVSGPQRSPSLPQVPTMREAGLRNADSIAWYGFMAPAGVPQALAERMNAAFNEALRDPAIVRKLAELGMQQRVMSRNEFLALIKGDTDHWGSLIRTLNISAE